MTRRKPPPSRPPQPAESKRRAGGTPKRAKGKHPSFSHTRAEDSIPRAPAHQGPEFLQHLFFHEYEHGGNFISVPVRRGNDEKGEEMRKDGQARGSQKEVVEGMRGEGPRN